MASNRKWTPQDDEDVLHLTQAGYCAETVAQVLGRSPAAVQGRLGQLRRAGGTLSLESSEGESSVAV